MERVDVETISTTAQERGVAQGTTGSGGMPKRSLGSMQESSALSMPSTPEELARSLLGDGGEASKAARRGIRNWVRSTWSNDDKRRALALLLRTVEPKTLNAVFGAPPYDFLSPTDAHALNATAINRNRSNLAYRSSSDGEATMRVPNYNQFGTPQFVDEAGRQYRAYFRAGEAAPDDWATKQSNPFGDRTELVCRVPKGERSLSIPRVSTTLTLTLVPLPKTGNASPASPQQWVLRVVAARVNDSKSKTGLLLVSRD